MLGKLHIRFMENGGDFVRKHILIASIIIVSINLLCACNSSDFDNYLNDSDWSYELPNNYVIWHINSKKIVCGKTETENSITNIIEDYIIKFWHNDQYVCLQCVNATNDPLEDIDESNAHYYIIDTLNEEVQGPFSKTEFEDKSSVLIAEDISTWSATKPRPEGATIP